MTQLFRRTLNAFIATAVACLLLSPVAFSKPDRQVPEGVSELSFKKDVLMLTTGLGEFPISIELAQYPDQHQRGLMYVQSMDQDEGMLFVFNREEPRSFWMRNTPLPLDILYIDSDGFIVSWVANTTPFSLQALPSNAPAQFVLELNAGSIDHFGIEVGDQISHPGN